MGHGAQSYSMFIQNYLTMILKTYSQESVHMTAALSA